MVILYMMNNAGHTEKKWLNFGGAITFQPVWRYSVRPGFETRLCYLVYSQARKLIGTARWPSSLGLLIEPSPHHCSPIGRPYFCKNENLGLALGEETAVQTVVGSIVSAFRRIKRPRRWEMSARGYALYSVCTQLYFSFPLQSLWILS